MQPEATDEELLNRLAAGETAAARTLVERNARAIHRLAHAIVGDAASAEDVTQETFARALAALGSFDPAKGRARTWLLAIARHVSFEMLRRRREMPGGDGGDAETLLGLSLAAGWGAGESVETATLRAETREQLVRALASLPARDREILVLREVEGLDGAEVAALLGVDLPAMKSRLHRARLRLVGAMGAFTEGIMTIEREAGGLRCTEVLDVLSDYVDGELGAASRGQVEGHLRGCTVCATFGGRFASVVDGIREKLGAEPALAPEVLAALTARLR